MRYISNDDPEIKKSAKVYANSINPLFDFKTNVFQRFSSWSYLKKIVAWILRYKVNLQRAKELSNERKKGKTTDIHPTEAIIPVSVIELKNAEREMDPSMYRANASRRNCSASTTPIIRSKTRSHR